jgi:hypothetical protein
LIDSILMPPEERIYTGFRVDSPKVVFTGYLVPLFNKSTLTIQPVMRWDVPELGLECLHNLTVKEGVVRDEVYLNKFDEAIGRQLLMQCKDLVQLVLDVAAFATGHSMRAEIDTMTDTEGANHSLLSHVSAIEALCTSFSVARGDLLSFIPFVANSPQLYTALHDLVSVLDHPYHASVNCARAIEGLRHIISPNAPRKQSWQAMRQVLRLTEDYIGYITNLSIAPRHGEGPTMPSHEVWEAIRRSWIIMDRYFHYLRGGNVPLGAKEFPELSN